MTTLEAQAKQKLNQKWYIIKNKFEKLINDTNTSLEEKEKKAYQKAERQVKQRLINQEKKIKNKQRAKEGKPLLKIKVKKINHMAKADFYFSRCIRSMHAQQLSEGTRYNKDVVTGQVLPIKDLTCGHYITRGTYTTRYHVGNCACQSHGTNKAEHHNPKRKSLFRQALVKLHGLHVVQEVEELAKARTKNENAKTDMKHEHEFRKNEYETKYKSMRE